MNEYAPKDVDGECNAHLYIGDDYEDNCATMRCQLPAGHASRHKQVWRDGRCEVNWDDDDRVPVGAREAVGSWGCQ